MRKNKMMRTASGLLVATLLTTSIISGTFAKYTTEASGNDTARVAKWGVTALVSGDLFGADYTSVGTSNDGNEISATYTGSVDSAKTPSVDSSKILAPGTQNSTGVTISISGTPEVANKVTFTSESSGDKANQNVFLKAGTYGTMVKATGVTEDNFDMVDRYTLSNGNYTKANQYVEDDKDNYYVLQDKVTLANDYYPIVWSVKDNTNNQNTVTKTKVEEVVTELNKLNTTTDNSSLNTIDKSYTITWTWNIENGETEDKKKLTNEADTILGNIVAKNTNAVAVKLENNDDYIVPTEKDDYNTTVAFNYSIKVEQVD